MKRKLNISILAALSVAVFLIMSGCGQAIRLTEQTFSSVDTVEAVGTTDISGISAEPLEKEVSAGQITWKVLNVSDQGTGIISQDNYTYQAIRGKFIILEFMVKNNSEERRILYDLNVIDSRGRMFSLCLPAYAYFSVPERACSITDILPDVEYTFDAPFDVAPDSEGLVLEVTDLKTPPEAKEYIDLGL